MPADLLSLYIDLEKGRKADLEVASRAAIAFAETVREIANFLDPLSDVRLDLVSTTEGSLSFNTKFRFKSASGPVELTIYAIVLICIGYIGAHVADFVLEKLESKVWEKFFGPDEANLSEKDKQDIAERVTKALAARAGEERAKRIYIELSHDPAVSGVGVSRNPNTPPVDIVPRAEFVRRSGVQIIEEPDKKSRKRIEIRKAVLISPVLIHDRKRRWKFKIGEHEFGAPIRDQYFLDAIFSGKHPLLLRGNVEMTIRLETKEKFVRGEWVESDHSVLDVIDVPGQYSNPQTSLPLNERQKPDDKHHRGDG